MVRGTHSRVWIPMFAVLVAASDGGCQDVGQDFHSVQRAVGTGASGSLAPAVQREARAPEGPQWGPSGGLSGQPPQAARPSTAERVPGGHLEGSGASARMVVPGDQDHLDVGTARLGEHYGVVWTDPTGSAVYFGRLDGHGQPDGAGQVLHRAVPDEEGIASPAIAASGDGYGVAWVDPENGRVRFRRVEASGVARGPAAIVHEGLEAPRVARIVWSGREFGVAVGQWRGVYFARIADNGARLGNGVLIDEGTTVGSLDGINWDGRGYTVSWSQQHDGRAMRLQQRLGASGEREGSAAVMGVINRPPALRGTRRVM